jgi:hypothetical protein
MKQIEVREGARRQHRTISLFCVIQCWLHGWDGIEISREQLRRLIGIQKFKDRRVTWMRQDFQEMFAYQRPKYDCGSTESFSSIELSRQDLEKKPVIGEFEMWAHPSKDDLARLYEGFIPFFADAATNYDERLLASYLSLLVQGQISPRSVPPGAKEDTASLIGQLPAEPIVL